MAGPSTRSVPTRRLLPESEYGIALLFNHTSALGLEQTAVIAGVTAIVQGNEPMAGPPISSRTVDWILAALTLIALALGIRGLLTISSMGAPQNRRPQVAHVAPVPASRRPRGSGRLLPDVRRVPVRWP